MRSLEELVSTQEPGITKIRECAASAFNECIVLPQRHRRFFRNQWWRPGVGSEEHVLLAARFL